MFRRQNGGGLRPECGVEREERTKKHSSKAEGLGDILPDSADKQQSEKQCDMLGPRAL